MRRVALAVVLVLSLLVPSSVAAAGSDRCSVSISPEVASPTDVVRILVSNVPVDPDGGSVEVDVHIRRLGTREGTIFFAFLVPGTTEFYVDYNAPLPGEPAPDPLGQGRYLVDVSTHVSGCYAVGHFMVR